MTLQSHSWACIWTKLSLNRHMHLRVHCSSIHNSQYMEKTQRSIDRRLDLEEVVYIHNGILLSHTKHDIMPFAATWMELETLMLSEVSQKEKDKHHAMSHIWNLIYYTNELFHRKENHGLGK